MSQEFSGKAVIPGQDAEVTVVSTLPPFAKIIGKAKTYAHDCRMPDRVQAPGQGKRPDKILLSLKERSWHCRNQSIGTIEEGFSVKGGIVTASGCPILGVSQLFWEKKYADAKQNRMPNLNNAKNLAGGFTVLPYSISARYNNFFHFVTEYMCLVPAIEEQRGLPDYRRVVITTDAPEEGSFQHGLLSAWFGERYEEVIFEPGIFRADSIAFPIDRCDYYKRINGSDTILSEMTLDAWHGMAGVLSAGLKEIYDRLSSQAPLHNDMPKIVIISRARAGRRRLINEEQLVEALSGYGACQVILEEYPVEKQIEIVANAHVLIGCHGAGMINAGFLKPGSLAVEMTSRQYLPRADDFAGQAALRDISYHVVLCDEDGDYKKESKLESNLGNDILLTDSAIKHIVDICRQHIEYM